MPQVLSEGKSLDKIKIEYKLFVSEFGIVPGSFFLQNISIIDL